MPLEVGAQPIPEDLCWPLDPACLTDSWDEFSTEVQERAAFLSVSTLRRLTAYRVGGCPITVRPCRKECCPPFYPGYEYGAWMYPQNHSGVWTNCCATANCNCTAECEVALPAPIGELIEVKSNGAVVPLTDFRVDNGHILVYEGAGTCPFNMTQDLSLPTTQPNTWHVKYLNAYPPDANAAYAAALLAMEFGKACSGGKCRLPAGVTDIVRNGVSMTITSGAFPDGVTGIREIDQFIALWKPEGSPPYAAKVWTPNMPVVRQTTRSY